MATRRCREEAQKKTMFLYSHVPEIGIEKGGHKARAPPSGRSMARTFVEEQGGLHQKKAWGMSLVHLNVSGS